MGMETGTGTAQAKLKRAKKGDGETNSYHKASRVLAKALKSLLDSVKNCGNNILPPYKQQFVLKALSDENVAEFAPFFLLNMAYHRPRLYRFSTTTSSQSWRCRNSPQKGSGS
jgi:hypothetical protein